MKMDEMYDSFGTDTDNMLNAIFSSIFIMQNRMQTACEKIQTQISMKQWLLLVMASICPEPRTLTAVGNLMGCSRQNVKKLALVLESKGFIRLEQGFNNSLTIELSEQAERYFTQMQERYSKTMHLMFDNLSEEEIQQLYKLYGKLYAGIERVENYAEKHRTTDT